MATYSMYHAAKLMLPRLLVLGFCVLLHPQSAPRLHALLSASTAHDLPHGQSADVAIILGYALFRSGEPTQPLKGRVEAGVQALQQGQAQRIIFSGAHPEAPGGGGKRREMSEANAMAKYARELLSMVDDVPNPQEWMLEEASTSTRENALYSLKLAHERGWTSILLVTSQFHQQRALWAFQRAASDLGLHPAPRLYVARVPFVGHKGYAVLKRRHRVFDSTVDVWDWVRECLAMGWYWRKGYI